jgi:TatD DNase family protein
LLKVIRINGCSLKTPENLEVLKEIPIGRMMFETGKFLLQRQSTVTQNLTLVDAPWCSMTSTQASRIHLSSIPENLKELYFPSSVKPESFSEGKVVKGRNEPCAIGGVAWVVSQIQGEPYDQVVATVYENTVRLFGLDKKL